MFGRTGGRASAGDSVAANDDDDDVAPVGCKKRRGGRTEERSGGQADGRGRTDGPHAYACSFVRSDMSIAQVGAALLRLLLCALRKEPRIHFGYRVARPLAKYVLAGSSYWCILLAWAERQLPTSPGEFSTQTVIKT